VTKFVITWRSKSVRRSCDSLDGGPDKGPEGTVPTLRERRGAEAHESAAAAQPGSGPSVT